MIGIGGGIDIPAYNRVLKPHIKKNQKDDPYLFLFADVITAAVKYGGMFIGEDQRESIGFVFANHKRWSIVAHEFYHYVRNDPDTPPGVKEKMGAVGFEDIDRFIPLQAADHLAFETYHRMNDPEGSPARPAMNRLMDWPQNHGNYYDEKQLLHYVELCKQDGILR